MKLIHTILIVSFASLIAATCAVNAQAQLKPEVIKPIRRIW